MPKGVYVRTEKHNKINSDNMKRSKKNKEHLKKLHSLPKTKKQIKCMYGKHMKEMGKISGRLPRTSNQRKASLVNLDRMNSLPRTEKQINASKRNAQKMGRIYHALPLDKHFNWRGGKSFEPYPFGWTKTYKEQIRCRDGHKCQLCGINEVDCGRKLHVHHKDYNKENIDESNLISLCLKCHIKTNSNRDYWCDYFDVSAKIEEE